MAGVDFKHGKETRGAHDTKITKERLPRRQEIWVKGKCLPNPSVRIKLPFNQTSKGVFFC